MIGNRGVLITGIGLGAALLLSPLHYALSKASAAEERARQGLSAQWDGTTLSLRGSVPNQAIGRGLTKQATLLFGEANVKAQINVASNTPTECVEATKATLPFLKSPIERGQFEARNGQLRLQGHVATSAMRQKMEEAIGRGIGKMRLISELTVDVEATPAPDQRPVATGTPIPVNVVQQQLNTMVGRDFGFPGGRKTLSPIQERALNRVAAILRQAPDATVEIGGHYRGGGSKKANDDHSWDCVRAVVLYLVEQGVPDSRMIGVGYGDRFPERGSASGTRIEFRVNAE